MQKLQLRGILEEGAQRGLRVADYSPPRVAELLELRHAVERIFFLRVMQQRQGRKALIGELEEIVGRMRELAGSADPIALSAIDLQFHRTIARHAGNPFAARMWEGLAMHMMIIFCRDWENAADRTGEVRLHEQLIEFVRNGSVADIDPVLTNHFSGPVIRVGSATS